MSERLHETAPPPVGSRPDPPPPAPSEQPPSESKSSIEISRNAKHEAVFKVKVYEGCEVEELTRLRELAVSNYRALQGAFYGTAAA